MSQSVDILGEEHRDRIWKDRNGDYWRWYQEDRQGWQYQHAGERWRFGGMHIQNCGPFAVVTDNTGHFVSFAARQVWETEYGQVSVHGRTVALELQRFSDLPDEPAHLRTVAAVLVAAAVALEATK